MTLKTFEELYGHLWSDDDEDLQFSAAHGEAYVLYKAVDGNFVFESFSSMTTDAFNQNWFGNLF